MSKLGNLPIGTRFSLDGRNGTLASVDSCAAKVQLDRIIEYWSLGSDVHLGWVGSDVLEAGKTLRVVVQVPRETVASVSKQGQGSTIPQETGYVVATVSKPTPGMRTRVVLFGEHPQTNVAYWMGENGWTFDRAKRVLDALGATLTDATLKVVLSLGKSKNVKSKPAPLTKDQIKEINRI